MRAPTFPSFLITITLNSRSNEVGAAPVTGVSELPEDVVGLALAFFSINIARSLMSHSLHELVSSARSSQVSHLPVGLLSCIAFQPIESSLRSVKKGNTLTSSRSRSVDCRAERQYLYFCTSKASKLRGKTDKNLPSSKIDSACHFRGRACKDYDARFAAI